MKIDQRGFTLIELLVVIAIIGILASVILASLNDARTEAIQVRLQTEMDGIVKRAAIEEISTFTYDTVCGSNGFTQSAQITELITSINSIASNAVTCNSDTSQYAISAPLGVGHWCVDNTGAKRQIANALVASPPGSQYECPSS